MGVYLQAGEVHCDREKELTLPLPEQWIIIESSSSPSTETDTLTWINWFCSLPGHEYFCDVAEDFIEDDFNLTGLAGLVPFYKEAMEMVLDVEPGTFISLLLSLLTLNANKGQNSKCYRRRWSASSTRRFNRWIFCWVTLRFDSSTIHHHSTRFTTNGKTVIPPSLLHVLSLASLTKPLSFWNCLVGEIRSESFRYLSSSLLFTKQTSTMWTFRPPRSRHCKTILFILFGHVCSTFLTIPRSWR